MSSRCDAPTVGNTLQLRCNVCLACVSGSGSAARSRQHLPMHATVYIHKHTTGLRMRTRIVHHSCRGHVMWGVGSFGRGCAMCDVPMMRAWWILRSAHSRVVIAVCTHLPSERAEKLVLTHFSGAAYYFQYWLAEAEETIFNNYWISQST